MFLKRVIRVSASRGLLTSVTKCHQNVLIRNGGTHYRSGAIKDCPETLQFGLVGIFCTVLPGLFVGAAISKTIANFLEENDLFVPSDDYDDDD